MSRKKKKSPVARFFSFVGTLLLIVLLLAIALPVYLFFTMRSMKVEPLDLKAVCEAAPMAVSERYTYENGELTVRYSFGEIVRKYTRDEISPEEVESIITQTLSGFIGTEPEAIGVRLEEDGVYVDGAVQAGPVRIAGSIMLQPECRDGSVFLRLDGVKIGLLKLKVKTAQKIAGLFGYAGLIDPEELVFPVDLSACPLLDELRSVSSGDGCLCMTGPWDAGPLLLMQPSKSQNGTIIWYSDEYRDVLDASERMAAGDADAADVLLSSLTEGKTLEDIYSSILTVLGGAGRNSVMMDLGGESTLLFPELDPEQAAAVHLELEKECDRRDALMRKLFTSAFAAQKNKRITVSEGRFLLDGKEFSAEKLLPGLAGEQWLDADGIEICISAMPGADVRGIRPLSSMSDSTDSFSTVVYGDLTYPVGIIVKTCSGSHLLYYQTYTITEKNGRQMMERTEQIPAKVYESCHKEGKATCVQNW